MNSVAQAASPKRLPQNVLWFCVPAANAGHTPTPLGRFITSAKVLLPLVVLAGTDGGPICQHQLLEPGILDRDVRSPYGERW